MSKRSQGKFRVREGFPKRQKRLKKRLRKVSVCRKGVKKVAKRFQKGGAAFGRTKQTVFVPLYRVRS